MNLVGSNKETMAQDTKILIREVKKIGLETGSTNEEKTKVMGTLADSD